MSEKSISLYYKKGSSDKVYKASLVAKDDGYVVNFAYGRRGNTLRTGTKTKSPVSLTKADAVYESLVNSKVASGYRSEESTESDYINDIEERDTGIRPQLLNPVDEADLKTLIVDNDWWLQEKHDGVRMMVQVNSDDLIAINRKGLAVGAAATIVNSLDSVPNGTLIDGEAVGDYYHVFDVLTFEGRVVENLTYEERYQLLKTIDFGQHVKVSETATNISDKNSLLAKCKQSLAEGVVIKNSKSKYLPGRPGKGGSQLKHKFYKTASVVVLAQNETKRSVQMGVVKEGKLTFVGNVTIPPSSPIPCVDSKIEVRYLYAYLEGSLYQPTFLFERTDIDVFDCDISQLEYKRAA